MSEQSPRYMAYLLRLWQTDDESGPHWHASIDCPHTAERRYFTGLETLFAYLQAQTTAPPERAEPTDALVPFEHTAPRS
jgi:hypothetical protein